VTPRLTGGSSCPVAVISPSWVNQRFPSGPTVMGKSSDWRVRFALRDAASVVSSSAVLDWKSISRFSEGDPGAVRDVYREYGRLVFAVAYKLLSDRDLAEEAVQQTFVQAWRASAAFDTARELGPWLATIARRAAIDIHRREARRSHRSLDDVDPADPALVNLPESVERAYEIWEVRRALNELPPDDATLIRLQHLEGFTFAEIAERLAIPLGTVKSRSFRAHRRLAGLLGHLRGDAAEPHFSAGRAEWIPEKPT
jgi:RNA polymerase sigma factor (sigma-70 family)